MLFRRRSADDFAEEIRSHLEMEADECEAEGMAAAEARRRAKVAFGNQTAAQEHFALKHRVVWLETVWQDVRFSFRMMTRNPGFTTVAVMTLAVGIAANTTVFAWIHAILLQPLAGVTEANRLVTVETMTSNGEWVPNSYPDFIDFRDHLRALRWDCCVSSRRVQRWQRGSGRACLGANSFPEISSRY